MSGVIPQANREALRLYRAILRRSRSFYWPNENGEPWCNVLKESARKEFEQSRFETVRPRRPRPAPLAAGSPFPH